MIIDILEPRIELLCEEYLLVQAWKKTSSYIRYHNWYSDTLELDRAAANLPRFLAEIAEQLKAPNQWINDPLRIVPAPKSQQWHVTTDTQSWEPADLKKTGVKLRPLAHVSIKDQVAATAVMLCLADKVETLQGDPRNLINNAETRRQVISYGNRLFCDAEGNRLHHRWGSGKLYRAYFQDYRSFLTRPDIVAEEICPVSGSRVVIVQSDLRQFFDRVRPELLSQKIDAIRVLGDDPSFYLLAHRLFDWEWHIKDSHEVAAYVDQAKLPDFSKVALPQGLVAAGFFANVVLLDFDSCLRETLSQEIEPGVRLEDACRYVDDLRLVLTVDNGKSLGEIEQLIAHWLQCQLDRYAIGMEPSKEKTKAAVFRGDERPFVRQSRKMERIQHTISGGFDAIGGEEILNAVQGLIRSQQRYSEQRTEDNGWAFSPIADVRDETVARFAAGRFRSTYRSLRPLLADHSDATCECRNDDADYSSHSCLPRTKDDLDDDARAFALGLIENWVIDPSNVRLLRIGLDIWPDADVLERVFSLLRPFTEKGGRRKAPRRVAWYCLAEIFRAGATETGFVEDDELLPAQIDISAYRRLLRDEAVRLSSLPAARLPWYLKQQMLLFLAASDTTQTPLIRKGYSAETKLYRELIRFMKGEDDGMSGADFATNAVIARRSYLGQEAAVQLVSKAVNSRRLELIAERDPTFALEIIAVKPELVEGISPRVRDDLCLGRSTELDGWVSLAEVVLQAGANGRLRNEFSLLRFALKFLTAWQTARETGAITPSDVLLKLRNVNKSITEVDEVKIVSSRVSSAGSMYRPPYWCHPSEIWRIQLGYLLRFILSTRQDFTRTVQPPHWKERSFTYRKLESHWHQCLYGLYNGHSAFGDDWLPITDWTEQLLSALLYWPGCSTSEIIKCVQQGIEATRSIIEQRLSEITEMWGRSSSTLLLPLSASWPARPVNDRPLRACIVQTVVPMSSEFKATDLMLNDPTFRRRHRKHLSTALAAIERMLDLRETHKACDKRLDWLILPELSVHPRDIKTHLIPFARAHKTIILAGLTYDELFIGQPLVNSAIWVIPVWTATHGLQIVTRRQGKCHLAPVEEKFNTNNQLLQGFRPCQWLIGYQWSVKSIPDRALWLTASICYDATDIRLAADLRDASDVFAIPAYNIDVNTFDNMAQALHYHMFQMVVVANNGQYGGSNAYAPYREMFTKQIFHLHGQPQASVAFFEIDNIEEFITRDVTARVPAISTSNSQPQSPSWKYPPAR